MTTIRTLAVALGAVVFELACLWPLLIGAEALARVDSLEHASYALRATGAITTFGLWFLTGGLAVFIALRLGQRLLRMNLLGAVFIAAAFNGFALNYVVFVAVLVNDSLWNVPFPAADAPTIG